MGIQINGTTNNINAGIGSLTIDDLREIDIVGVATASNFKTGSSNLHSTGLTVGDSFVHSTGLNVGSNIKLGSAGVITATAFHGDGSQLSGVSAGLGTALSDVSTNPLNKLYYTDRILSIGATVTVNHPASATGAYTQYADIQVEDTADLIVEDGDDLIPDIFGLADDSTGGAGGVGRLRVGTITNKTANGAPNFPNGLTANNGMISAQGTGAGSGASQIQIQPYGTDGYINCTASNNLYTRMGTGFAIRTRIDGNGHFHITSGNLVIDTSGKGIDFSDTGDGSGTDSSEVLDDYEEGSWTPTWAPTSGSFTNVTYSVRLGKYVKVGNLVTLWMHTHINSVNTSGGSGGLTLGGLPYTVGSGTVGDGGSLTLNYYTGFSNVSNQVVTGYTAYNNSHIRMTKIGGNNSTGINYNDLGNGHCYGCVSYNIG